MKILSCPFCKSMPAVSSTEISCMNDTCTIMPVTTGDDIDSTIIRWNTVCIRRTKLTSTQKETLMNQSLLDKLIGMSTQDDLISIFTEVVNAMTDETLLSAIGNLGGDKIEMITDYFQNVG